MVDEDIDEDITDEDIDGAHGEHEEVVGALLVRMQKLSFLLLLISTPTCFHAYSFDPRVRDSKAAGKLRSR